MNEPPPTHLVQQLSEMKFVTKAVVLFLVVSSQSGPQLLPPCTEYKMAISKKNVNFSV